MTIETAAPAPSARAARRFGAAARRVPAALWTGALLAVLTFLILYPALMLVVGAITEGNPVVDPITPDRLSLANFLDILANPAVLTITANTLVACGLGTVVAVGIGLVLSWIVVRTNTPGSELIAFAGLLPLFVPPLVAGIAWSILGSPTTGLLNVALAAIGIEWRFNFYSMAGIVAVFGLYYAPYVFMFATAALRNIDPALEEAAQICGAGPARILLSVTLPLIAPAILAGALLSFVVMLGTYGIPGALGAPARISVLTTYIYKLVSWSPPLFNAAAAVAVVLLVLTAGLVLLQHKLLTGRSYVTVAGKAFRPRRLNLGRWRFATLALALAYLLVAVVLPTFATAVAAFRRFLFIADLSALFDPNAYSLVHFEKLYTNPVVWRSVLNTLEMALFAAALGGALALAVGYTVHRTRLRGRHLVDMAATLPVAIPGLVIGVAYLWAWIRVPGGLYGSLWILGLALVARFLPDAVKALSTSLLQIHRELEEAAWISGRGRLFTILFVVAPLARPGLVAAVSLLFILAVRELGSSLFLFTTDTIVMAVLLLNLFEGGNLSVAAAFAFVQIVLLLAVVSASHLAARRWAPTP